MQGRIAISCSSAFGAGNTVRGWRRSLGRGLKCMFVKNAYLMRGVDYSNMSCHKSSMEIKKRFYPEVVFLESVREVLKESHRRGRTRDGMVEDLIAAGIEKDNGPVTNYDIGNWVGKFFPELRRGKGRTMKRQYKRKSKIQSRFFPTKVFLERVKGVLEECTKKGMLRREMVEELALQGITKEGIPINYQDVSNWIMRYLPHMIKVKKETIKEIQDSFKPKEQTEEGSFIKVLLDFPGISAQQTIDLTKLYLQHHG